MSAPGNKSNGTTIVLEFIDRPAQIYVWCSVCWEWRPRNNHPHTSKGHDKFINGTLPLMEPNHCAMVAYSKEEEIIDRQDKIIISAKNYAKVNDNVPEATNAMNAAAASAAINNNNNGLVVSNATASNSASNAITNNATATVSTNVAAVASTSQNTTDTTKQGTSKKRPTKKSKKEPLRRSIRTNNNVPNDIVIPNNREHIGRECKKRKEYNEDIDSDEGDDDESFEEDDESREY